MSAAPAVTIYAVFACADEAERIGRTETSEGLAACVNILPPCHSIYRWQGAIEQADEVPALFKSRADLADALIARIASLHSYDVPAIVAWPIAAGHGPYLDWIAEETRTID
jgi:periplasmic divalent cation tolerance protein